MDPKPDPSTYSSEMIEIEIDGQAYRGERIVTRGLDPRQEVRFGLLQQEDPNQYDQDEEIFRLHIAKVILRDLVERWKAQEVRRPVKVEPHATPQRRRRDR